MSSHPIPTEPKKKFGKNLNKLTKPPPPPPLPPASTTRRGSSTEQSSSSRNGLLLLSGKRSSSGGLLSKRLSAPKPVNTPSLRSEIGGSVDGNSSTSAGGGWGLNKSEGESNHGGVVSPPAAWGGLGGETSRKETQTQQPVSVRDVPILAPKGGVSASYYGKQQSDDGGGGYRRMGSGKSGPITAPTPPTTAPWGDEHWEDEVKQSGTKDPKTAFGRSSSQTSSNQSLRAEPPLESLNSYQQPKPNPPPSNPKPNGVTPPTPAPHPPKPPPDTNGRGVDLSSFAKPSSPTPSDEQVRYMSRLARERAAKRQAEEQARMNEQRERAARRLKELEDKMTTTAANANGAEKKSWGGSGGRQKGPSGNNNLSGKANMSGNNNLSGKANVSGNNNSGEIVLELLGRPKHDSKKPPSVAPNEVTTTVPTKALIDPGRSYSSLVGGTPTKTTPTPSSPPPPSTSPPIPIIHLSSYDDLDRGETHKRPSGPRMLFDPKTGALVEAPTEKPRYHHDEPKKRRPPKKKEPPVVRKTTPPPPPSPKRKLPRTRGVLFHYDTDGIAVSADGCPADRGYGMHSVPGGRLRNPNQFQKTKKNPTPTPTPPPTTTTTILSPPQPPSPPPPPLPRVQSLRTDERIEILAQEEPELQATANPWAPSEAALKAVRERNGRSVEEDIVDLIGEREEEEEGEVDFDASPSFIGLGFDPTQNMDSVMMSPSLRSENITSDDDDIVLTSLSLGAPTPTSPPPTSFVNTHITTHRPFLSSSTWGTSGLSNPVNTTALSMGHVDWSMRTSENDPPSTSKPSNPPPPTAATFLSLSPLSVDRTGRNTWATPATTTALTTSAGSIADVLGSSERHRNSGGHHAQHHGQHVE